MSDLEQTQAIFLDDYDEETDEDIEKEKKIVAYLKVNCQRGFPERKFPLYEGDNIIGRQEDVCNIAIPLKALSREHACIEIRGDSHLIYDKGSRNKTKRNTLYLKPDVRYELKDNDSLTFGDVSTVYHIGKLEEDDDGSDTASESEFQTAPTGTLKLESSVKSATGKSDKTVPTTLVYESDEDYESDQSVDLLQPTQAFTSNKNTKENGRSLLNLGAGSDEESNNSKNLTHNITVKDTPAPPRRTGITQVTVEESGSETEGEDDKDHGKDDSKESSIMIAATQAYVRESDDDDTDADEDDPVKKNLLVAETQSFTEGGGKEKGNKTQSFIQESDTDEDQEEIQKIQSAATQAFPSNRNEIPVTEVEIGDEEEDDEEDMSHLLANPTMACDLDLNVPSNEEATQAFSEQDLQEGKKQKKGNTQQENATLAVCDDATQVVSDATVAVTDDAIQVVSDATVAVTDDATQVVSDATVAVTDDATQVVSDTTVAVTHDATQVVSDATVAVTDDATQVVSDATVAVTDDATQCFDDATIAVSDAATLAVDVSPKQKRKKNGGHNEEATQVFEENEVAETQVFEERGVPQTVVVGIEEESSDDVAARLTGGATLAMMDDLPVQAEKGDKTDIEATQVFDDATQVFENETLAAETVSKKRQGTKGKKKGKITADTLEATQVFDDATVALQDAPKMSRSAKSKQNKRKGVEELEPTQVFDDATVAVIEDPTVAVSGEEATQIFDNATVAAQDNQTVAISADDATQVFDMSPPSKGRKSNEAEKQPENEAATQMMEEAVDEKSDVANDDATQVFDDATVAIADVVSHASTTSENTVQVEEIGDKPKGRGRGRKSKLVEKPDPSAEEDKVIADAAKDDTDAQPVRGRGRRALKASAEASKAEVPTAKKGRGKKTTAACNEEAKVGVPETIVNMAEDKQRTSDGVEVIDNVIGDNEDTPPLETEIPPQEDEEGDISASAPRRGRKRGRGSTAITETTNDKAPTRTVRGRAAKGVSDEVGTKPAESNEAEDEGTGRGRRGSRNRQQNQAVDKGESATTTSRGRGRAATKAESPKKSGVLDDTQPYIEGSTVPEATQVYTMETDEEDATEATQAYTMDTDEAEDGDTTPPVSEVIGIPVVEGEPTKPFQLDSDEYVPSSHKSEDPDMRSPLISIPSRSPYKSALVSPEKRRNKSPSPKRVMFAKRDSEKSVEDEETEPVTKKGRMTRTAKDVDIQEKQPKRTDTRKAKADDTALNVVDESGDKDSETTGDKEEVTVGKGRRGRGRKSLPATAVAKTEVAPTRRGRRSVVPTVTTPEESTDTSHTGDSQVASTSHDADDEIVEHAEEKEEEETVHRGRGKRRGRAAANESASENVEKKSTSVTRDRKTTGDAKEEGFKSEQTDTKSATRRGGNRKKAAEENASEVLDSVVNKQGSEQTSITDEQSMEDMSGNVRPARGRRKGKAANKTSDSQNDSKVEASSSDTGNIDERGDQQTDKVEDETESKEDRSVSDGVKRTKGRRSMAPPKPDTQPSKGTGKGGRGKGKKGQDDSQPVESVNETTDSGTRGRSLTRKGVKDRDKSTDSQQSATGIGNRSSVSSQDGQVTTARGRGSRSSVDSQGDQQVTRGKGRASQSSVSSQEDVSEHSQSSTSRRKRKGEGQEEVSSKKTKMEAPSTPQAAKSVSANVASPSLRRTSVDPSKPKVMFTGVVDEQGQKIVKDLGGELVASVFDCTHLVTDKVRRTVKFLCCLSRGIPIVTLSWLDSCKSSAMFVDSTPFLVKDPTTEKQYKFSLQSSIDKAAESSLLQGYRIHVTKSVRPDPPQMKDIIVSAGAEFLPSIPKKHEEKTVVISCPDDRSACEPALKVDIPVVNAEFVLTGILRQEVDMQSFRIFADSSGQKRGRDSSVGDTSRKRRK